MTSRIILIILNHEIQLILGIKCGADKSLPENIILNLLKMNGHLGIRLPWVFIGKFELLVWNCAETVLHKGSLWRLFSQIRGFDSSRLREVGSQLYMILKLLIVEWLFYIIVDSALFYCWLFQGDFLLIAHEFRLLLIVVLHMIYCLLVFKLII